MSDFSKALTILLILSSFGCASTMDIQSKRQLLNNTIPYCYNEQDCKVMWEAAQVWVANNCGMKIQLVTDSIIQTYNPTRYSTRLAAKVVKEPVGTGKYRLLITTWCDNIFACFPNQWDAAIDFNRYVSSITKKSNYSFSEQYNYSDKNSIQLEDIGVVIKGYRIASVKEGSPGEVAGLKENDYVMAINGNYITGDLAKDYSLFKGEPGTTLTILIDRSDEELSIDVIRNKNTN